MAIGAKISPETGASAKPALLPDPLPPRASEVDGREEHRLQTGRHPRVSTEINSQPPEISLQPPTANSPPVRISGEPIRAERQYEEQVTPLKHGLEVDMQQWFPLAVFALTFALVVIVILYRLVIGGGSISRASSGGSHGSIYDGSPGTTGSDCGSSGGGDGGGGSCGGSG